MNTMTIHIEQRDGAAIVRLRGEGRLHDAAELAHARLDWTLPTFDTVEQALAV